MVVVGRGLLQLLTFFGLDLYVYICVFFLTCTEEMRGLLLFIIILCLVKYGWYIGAWSSVFGSSIPKYHLLICFNLEREKIKETGSSKLLIPVIIIRLTVFFIFSFSQAHNFHSFYWLQYYLCSIILKTKTKRQKLVLLWIDKYNLLGNIITHIYIRIVYT